MESAAKNKIRTILRINKNFQDEELPRELFLTTRQTTKIIYASDNNMSTDIKLSKAQMSKIIQLGGVFASCLDNIGKRVPTNIAIPLDRDNCPGLVSNLASNTINRFERKISDKGAVRTRKVFTLFISNKDMDDTIKIIKPLENSDI